jgi:flagellar biosynthesis protein FlhF
MQIKRFEAKSMTAALRLIKEELGPEAVILSARSIKKRSGIMGSFKNIAVEVTAATDSHHHTDKYRLSSYRNERYQGDHLLLSKYYQAESNQRIIRNEKESLDAVVPKKYLEEEKEEVRSKGRSVFFALYRQLLSQDVAPDIAVDLTEGLKIMPDANKRLAKGDIKQLLVSLLESMGLVTDPIHLHPVKTTIMALVGTTGVGKTTTTAKLAAHFAMEQNKKVALVTMDDYRLAAIQQLNAYAKIIGIPLQLATSPSELKGHLKRFKNKDLILIDTAGFSQNNHNQITELNSYFDKLNKIEIQIVLSATTKEIDLINTLNRLNRIQPARLIFTKLDESNTFGNLLNTLVRTKMHFSYFTDGQQIPDDFEEATIEKLVELLLRNMKERNIQSESKVYSAEKNMTNSVGNLVAPGARQFFVANRNSDVYHIAGCKWTKKIKHANIIEFESSEIAEQNNYLPCQNCNPHRVKKYSLGTFVKDNITISRYR